MTKRSQLLLRKSYRAFKAKRQSKRTLLRMLRSFMPEIIFRTTKLEGEPVTRKLVRSLFR